MTVSIIRTVDEIYTHLGGSEYDDSDMVIAAATTSTDEEYAVGDLTTVVSQVVLSAIEIISYFEPASTVQGTATISSTEGSFFADQSLVTGLAQFQTTEATGFINVSVEVASAVLSATDAYSAIDSAIVSGSNAISAVFANNVYFDSDTMTATGNISAAELHNMTETSLVGSTAIASAINILNGQDSTTESSLAVISSLEQYQSSGGGTAYVDSDTILSSVQITALDGQNYTDSGTIVSSTDLSSPVSAAAFVKIAALLDQASGTVPSSTILVSSFGCAAGNTLILVGTTGGNGFSAISDTQGNPWTVDSQVVVGTTLRVAIGSTYLQNALTGADTITVTYSLGTSGRTIVCAEYSGVLSSPVDAAGFGITTGGTGLSGSVTGAGSTTQGNELVVGAFGFMFDSLGTVADPGFTLRGIANSTGTRRGIALEDQIVSSTGIQTASASWGSSKTWAAIVGTYKSQSVGNELHTSTDIQTTTGFSAISSLDSLSSVGEAGTVSGSAAFVSSDRFTATDSATKQTSAVISSVEIYTPGSGINYTDAATITGHNQIPTTDTLTGFYVEDSFNRTLSGSWGTPSQRGAAWVQALGNTADVSVSGGLGKIQIVSNTAYVLIQNITRTDVVPSPTIADPYQVVQHIKFRWDINSAGGSTDICGHVGYWTDSNNNYHIHVIQDSSGAISITGSRVLNNISTTVYPKTQFFASSPLNTDFVLKTRWTNYYPGSSQGPIISGKLWNTNQAEPAYTTFVNDSGTSLSSIPSVTTNWGIRCNKLAAVTTTPTISFSSYLAAYYGSPLLT